MPRVTIRTGFVGTDGREETLSEFFCDTPGCSNVATEVVGVVKEIGLVTVVCGKHAAPSRAPQTINVRRPDPSR